jgi:hypothetical protein
MQPIGSGVRMMRATYKAILRGNRLEWSDEAPVTTGENPLMVHVTILDEQKARTQQQLRGQLMATRLEQIAAKHAMQAIPDPVAWEREMRTDRLLPDRD